MARTPTEKQKVRFLVLVVALLSLAGFALQPMPCPDTFWHISAGRQIRQTGTLASHDTFSFSAGDHPWLNHEWLAELIFFGVWKMGGVPAVLLLRPLLVMASFGLIPWLAFRETTAPIHAVFPVALLACGQGLYFVDARAYLFTYLFLSITMLSLVQYRHSEKWWWLVVVVSIVPLWANMHGGFILGPGVWGLAAVGFLYERKFRLARNAFIVTTLGLLGALLNPYGIEIWKFPFSLSGNNIYTSYLNEWQAPFLKYPGHGILLILPAIACAAMGWRKAEPWRWIAAIVFVGLSLKTWRHGPLAALVLIYLLWDLIPALGREWSKKTQATVLSALTVLSLIWLGYRVQGGAERWAMLETHFPGPAVEVLKKNPTLPARILNPYEWGGYLTLAVPDDYKIFIDGRAHTVYPGQVYADALELQYGDSVAQRIQARKLEVEARSREQVLERYDAQLLLCTKVQGQGDLVPWLRSKPDWMVIYEDRVAAIFLKNTPENKALELDIPVTGAMLRERAAKVAGTPKELEMLREAVRLDSEDAESQFRLGLALFVRGDHEGAMACLNATLELDDRYPYARQCLGRIALARGDSEEAANLFLEELSYNPNDRTRELLEEVMKGGLSN